MQKNKLTPSPALLSFIIRRAYGNTQRESYRLEAMAQDKGYPPLSRSVEVQIDVVDRANNPPVWDHVIYGPIYIRENFPVGAKVVSVKARSVLYGGSGHSIRFSKKENFVHFFLTSLDKWTSSDSLAV